MRWMLVLVALAVSACACVVRGPSERLPQVSSDCGASSCAVVLPVLDADGAPLNGATVLIPFDQAIRTGASSEVAVVNTRLDLETREPDIAFAGVKSLWIDPSAPKQLAMEVDAFLADGAAIAFGKGVLQSEKGKPLPAFEVTLTTPWSPLAVSLANVGWDPADPMLMSDEGIQAPMGAVDEAAVRAELEDRLWQRGIFSDEQIDGVLAQFDSARAKQKVPNPRVRAGLLMLWGTSAEFAIEFIFADSNRRGVPFEPVAIDDLDGAYAAVFYHPLDGHLRMHVDDDMAREGLEAIATVLAHEAVHSDLGGGSVTEEMLAMASSARVYQEFLLTDPTLALSPTSFTRDVNQLVLAMRNSGRYGYPRAGILPRPGVDDALRGTGVEPARSFGDLLAKPHVYGDYNPRAGDTGTEVLEAYYGRISGESGDQGRLRYDDQTVKLFDKVMDHGFSDEQILQISDALRLRPVTLR
jgi:hypothetical protein